MPDLFYTEEEVPPPGTVTGLAWTGNGGSTLYIECAFKSSNSITNTENKQQNSENKEKNSNPPPTKNIQITGNLGNVMQESVSIATTFAQNFISEKTNGQNCELLTNNIHVHVPEGATPKDGPSAGITITTSLISLALNRPVNKKFAMTGEISLNGKVLPVGGIREKIIAAKREGIKDIILPLGTKNQLEDMPESVYANVNIHFVDKFREVYELVFS